MTKVKIQNFEPASQSNPADLDHHVIELLTTGVIVLDNTLRIVGWNTWMVQHSGIDNQFALQKGLLDVVPEITGSRIQNAVKKALENNSPSVLSAKLIDASFPLYKESITTKRAHDRLVQSILIKPFNHSKNGRHCVICIQDISSSDTRERALRRQTQVLNTIVSELKDKEYELQTLFKNTQNGILVFDQNGSIINANPAAYAILKLDVEFPEEKKVYHFFTDFDKNFFGSEDTQTYLRNILPVEDEGEVEWVATQSDGNKIPISLSANIIPYDNKTPCFFVFFRDITDKKDDEKKLYKMARYDALTGLTNRFTFTEILDRTIKTHDKNDTPLSIFFIDLDRFKFVNDTYGHGVGDVVLKVVCERLLNQCRSTDVVARWAGDEFVLLLEQQNMERSAITVAEKIIDTVKQPIFFQGKEIYIGCSIGIAQFPENGKTVDALISKADQAMYQAKAEGKSVFRFFTPAMNSRMAERLRTESELRIAINKQQFILYYQPQMNVVTGELAGVEALIRWNHPERGVILPNRFIPVAEECGLISEIGDWVIKTAIASAADLQLNDHCKLDMSINLSAQQFLDGDLVTKLANLIDFYGADPNHIILEITENYLVGETRRNLVVMNAIRALGVRIAIDDFGTGYSSLAYLRTLPVDILKIDRAFIIDSNVNKASAHIVSAIIELAHALNLEVIAEGIENAGQMDLLKEQGCDLAQGFLMAIPMDIDTLRRWNRRN